MVTNSTIHFDEILIKKRFLICCLRYSGKCGVLVGTRFAKRVSMNFILELLFNAAILLLLSKYMESVHVKSFGTAVLVALVVAILNATIGALLRFPLNLVTLFLLGFIVRLIVTAVMIKIADAFFSGFRVDGFRTALIVAVIMAIAGALFSYIIY
jgi:putative membrane protein